MKAFNHDCPFTVKIALSITEFDPAQWNGLVRSGDIPFLEWEWLAALEKSGSVCPETGWYPLHLSLWDKDTLLAAAPLYLKNHSDGEFVWDYMWARAAASLGTPWYPKLTGVVPATPAEGYRFLAADNFPDRALLDSTLLDAAEALCRNNGIQGLHLLFADPSWASRSLVERGYYAWKHQRYVWENPGFAGFDDYLAGFTKNQRKNIRREYRRHEEQGIGLRIVDGAAAGQRGYFDAIHDLYTITNDKFVPWDARWVNGEFFRLLGSTYSRRVVFSEAYRKGRQAAGEPEETAALAMMIRTIGRLWGRYWGAYEDIKDLHFAVCYYAPMDYCIREDIRYFDPGAGSPHKIRRGFRPAFDTSYHKFFDPALEKLFGANIGEVNSYEEEIISELNGGLPLKGARPLL
ncbi:MAG: GNAT family N-acetyltransferase [Treponema sp.]|jgi:predicted N-acyltransferase|nr:GNAT family N-acetyltransferase [Treponema sp.]